MTDPTQAQAAPTFTVDEQTFTLDEMLGANALDAELCAWVRTAAVGDVCDGCERVS